MPNWPTMARQLLNLRDVPHEEADALRAALNDAGLAYYETPASAFGISAGGIWIRDEADWAEARALYDRFQADYARAARDSAVVEPLWTSLRRHPGRFLGRLALVIGILLLMLWPVLELWAD